MVGKLSRMPGAREAVAVAAARAEKFRVQVLIQGTPSCLSGFPSRSHR